MQEAQLMNVYNSLIINEIRIIGSEEIQREAWIEGTGNVVCTFVDIVAGFLEDMEILLDNSQSLPKEIQNIFPRLRMLYEKVLTFYRDIIENHSSMEIEEIMKENRWKLIQKEAQKLYEQERV